MQRTSIAWTDFSSNPLKYRDVKTGETVWACVKVSPGCAHCYSEKTVLRWNCGKLFTAANMREVEPYLCEHELHTLLTRLIVKGKAVPGSRCFVGDMTDVFGEWVPDEMLDRLFATFALRPDVTFQVLTKRAERMAAYMRAVQDDDKDLQRFGNAACEITKSPCAAGLIDWPLRNVHLGVSVEDQQRAYERIPWLLKTPAAVRFLSVEPMLGEIEFSQMPNVNGYGECQRWYDPLKRLAWVADFSPHYDGCHCEPGIDWVICGCESGPGRRPMQADWARSLRDQCAGAAVPFFMKQMAIDGRVTQVMAEFPADLQVREFPVEHQSTV